jgi:hypothetical protein
MLHFTKKLILKEKVIFWFIFEPKFRPKTENSDIAGTGTEISVAISAITGTEPNFGRSLQRTSH